MPECSVYATPFSPSIPDPGSGSTVFVSSSMTSAMSPAHTLVGEAMVIAGRVAARFCLDRKIPVLYRGQGSMGPDVGDGQRDRIVEQNIRERCEKSGIFCEIVCIKRIGMLPYNFNQDLFKYMSGAVNDPLPLMHSSMGIPGIDPESGDGGASGMVGYLKVTSPLRRFMDMVRSAHFID